VSGAGASEWPESNNFHAVVPGVDPESLAAAFAQLGWRVGKDSWHEYSVASDWAEFTFIPADGVLVAGAVVTGRYEDAVTVFGAVGHPCIADPEAGVEGG
jgi:hypothetical protein